MNRKESTPAAALNTDPGKAAKVEQERARLMKLFAGKYPNKLDFIRDAVQQLAWLNISIMELQGKIDRFGTLVTYDNGGGQSGVKPNPDLKTLIDYQKLANTITRTLNTVIPIKETGTPGGGRLADMFSCDDEDETPEEARKRMERDSERLVQLCRAVDEKYSKEKE